MEYPPTGCERGGWTRRDSPPTAVHEKTKWIHRHLSIHYDFLDPPTTVIPTTHAAPRTSQTIPDCGDDPCPRAVLSREDSGLASPLRRRCSRSLPSQSLRRWRYPETRHNFSPSCTSLLSFIRGTGPKLLPTCRGRAAVAPVYPTRRRFLMSAESVLIGITRDTVLSPIPRAGGWCPARRPSRSREHRRARFGSTLLQASDEHNTISSETRKSPLLLKCLLDASSVTCLPLRRSHWTGARRSVLPRYLTRLHQDHVHPHSGFSNTARSTGARADI